MYRILLVLLLAPLFSFSKPIEKKVWLTNFTKTFLVNFCDAPEMLNCYETMRPPCKEMVLGKIKSCAEKTKVPNAVNLGPESGLLGAEMGRCIGLEIEPTLKKKNTESPKCKNLLQ